MGKNQILRQGIRSSEIWVPYEIGPEIKGTVEEFTISIGFTEIEISVITTPNKYKYKIIFDSINVSCIHYSTSDRVNYVNLDIKSIFGGIYVIHNSTLNAYDDEEFGLVKTDTVYALPGLDACVEISASTPPRIVFSE